MAGLIDTSVLVAWERRRSSVESLRSLTEDGSAYLATITVSELLVGVHRARDPLLGRRRLAFIEEALLPIVTLLDLDMKVAEAHAELQADLAKSGKSIGAHDLIIAATAVAHQLTLLTLDVRHFSHIPGLSMIQPFTP